MRLHPSLIPAAFTLVASSARAQIGPFEQVEPIPYCPEIVSVFVDGGTGIDPDPTNITEVLTHLNNPAKPFQTIQLAIDVAQFGVGQSWHPIDNPNGQAVVYVMPGVYGPTSWQAMTPGEAFDILPIQMRDRVHVQGQGMRSTTIRGGGSNPNQIGVFWPNFHCCGNNVDAQVLVDFSFESDLAGGSIHFGTPPWAGTGDSEEMIDRIGFQGGDIQVLSDGEGLVLGRVSNCLFDMRDGLFPDDQVTGPYIGLMMSHLWFGEGIEYYDMPFKILNNTFVFGEESPEQDHLARADAVGVIDVNKPICNPATCLPSPGGDPITELRGVGNPSIQNNLFRTLTSQTTQRAMLGIKRSDTEVAVGGGTAPGPTNAFAAGLVGGNNALFHSKIPPLGSPVPPVPKVNLAVLSLDPSFVGELLSPLLVNAPEYRDWRLIFGSSLQGRGSGLNAFGQLVASNGTTYHSPFCYEYSSFRWDGEGYGNPRVVDAIEIGCDEIHLMTMAGTWGNDSVSHNQLPGVLEPNVTDVGGSRRFILFPSWAAVGGNTSTVNGIIKPYAYLPPPSIAAWTMPPGAVSPKIDGSLPAGYQKRYIPFTNPPPTPTPWTGAIGATTLTNPLSGVIIPVGIRVKVDAEGTGPATYFNTQSVVTLPGGPSYRSNLQAEYR